MKLESSWVSVLSSNLLEATAYQRRAMMQNDSKFSYQEADVKLRGDGVLSRQFLFPPDLAGHLHYHE